MSYMHRIRGMNSHLAAALGLNPEIVSRLCCMLLDGWPEALLSCLSLRGLVGLPSQWRERLLGAASRRAAATAASVTKEAGDA